jgi:ATP-binding cassette subfamily C protein CydC
MIRLTLAVLAGAAAELAGVALLGTATWLLVTAAGRPPVAVLSLAIVSVRALAIGKGLGRYAERVAGHDAALRILARLRTRAYAAVAHRREASGDLLTRLVSDVDGVQDALLRCAAPVAVAGVVAAAALAFVTAYAPAAAGVLAAGLLLAAVAAPAVAYALSRRVAADAVAARAALAIATLDVVHGAAELAAYGAGEAALARAARHARTVAAAERRAAPAVLGAATAALPGLTALGVLAVTLPGTAGTRAAVTAVVALGAVEAALPVRAAATRYADLRPALARVRDLLARPPARPAASAPDPTDPVAVRLRGAVVRYAPGATPALDGVDVILPPGYRLAVVGPSGSGKSTLLGLLTGEVPLSGGRLTFDGAGCDPARRWRIVGGLTAGAHVFHATVRENLTLGRPELSTVDLMDALETVGLPGRLDTTVGEDGARLSGGERQRLLLARALAGKAPPVLVLDEPTEGLDPDAADAVLREALAAAGARTVVLVTHRLTGLRAFDEILVLDGGRVAQRGDHATLLARPGWYADAYRSQELTARGYPGSRVRADC